MSTITREGVGGNKGGDGGNSRGGHKVIGSLLGALDDDDIDDESGFDDFTHSSGDLDQGHSSHSQEGARQLGRPHHVGDSHDGFVKDDEDGDAARDHGINSDDDF